VTPERQALVGLGVDAIDTPALVIDLDAMERNLHRMADFAHAHGVKLRPHAKMHKCAALGRLQIEAGAVGLCVQKTAEAERLAERGITDLFISNQVIAPAKLARVAALARRLHAAGGQLAIAVDSALGVERLAQAMTAAGPATQLDVFVELDVGQHRCGVAPGPAAVALVREVLRHPALRYAGLQAYQGSAQHQRSAAQRRATIEEVAAEVARTCTLLRADGIEPGLVTGAGTGTFALEAASGVFGELQAGSYLFMDADYALNRPDPAQPAFEHALYVKTQIISRSDDHAVCDAGHKSYAVDSGLPLVHGSDLQITGASDEAGVLRGPALPARGDILWLIPGHCDPTVNLHDAMVGVRGGLARGRVERILAVDARGALT